MYLTAARRHVVGYDNVGHITQAQSDDLCRIATGFGYSTRTLHTTDEETTFEFARPQIITAIDALVTRDDLADRVLMAQLGEIAEEKRLPHSQLQQNIADAKPRILGALLTALTQTLAELPNTQPERLPRMADYAKFAIASEKALGLKAGKFLEVFDTSRETARAVVIEASPLAEAIVKLVKATPIAWKGTASQLLQALESHTDDATYRSRFFPKSSNSLSRQLNRLAPDLKAVGIQIVFTREGDKWTRFICIEKELKISSVSSVSSGGKPKASHSKDLTTDGITDDTDGITDDTDDTSSALNPNIVGNQSTAPPGFQQKTDDTDDIDDKNLNSSKAPEIKNKIADWEVPEDEF